MATVMLLLWPVVALALFAKLGREKGLIWTVVAGYLLLPEPPAGIELPGLPDYFKFSAIAFSATLGFLFFRERPSWPDDLAPPAPTGRDVQAVVIFLLVAIFCVGAFMTVLTNGSPLVEVASFRPGLRIWDWVAMTTEPMFPTFGFFFAWLWLRSPRHHEELLKVIVIMGVIYSVLALVEMRLSPQINQWVYGYFPHSFLQHVRGGEYRPLVFLRHGLWLAFFLLTAAIAAFGLFRSKTDPQLKAVYLCAGLFILAVLFLSPNLGTAMLAVIFVPLALFCSRGLQVRVAFAIAILFMAFPAVRHTIPLEKGVEFVERISVERAQSLAFRLNNEDELLDRGLEKPLFGWGGWSRSRIFNDQGVDVTTADGAWVIFFGLRGWVGYLSYFGLFAIPVLLLTRAMRKKDMSPSTAVMASIGAANLIYLIPNSTLSPIGWLMAGAVAGFVSWRPAQAPEHVDETPDLPQPSSPYTRFAHDRTATERLYSRPGSRPTTRRVFTD